jgi:hypothetical protein
MSLCSYPKECNRVRTCITFARPPRGFRRTVPLAMPAVMIFVLGLVLGCHIPIPLNNLTISLRLGVTFICYNLLQKQRWM